MKNSWTTQQPTEPGYYWWRSPIGRYYKYYKHDHVIGPHIAEILSNGGVVDCSESWDPWHMPGATVEWYPIRIHPPKGGFTNKLTATISIFMCLGLMYVIAREVGIPFTWFLILILGMAAVLAMDWIDRRMP